MGGINIIKLYNANEIDFTHNGLGILKDTINAKIIEELNGNFTLDLEYPLNGQFVEFLLRGNIIKCPVGDSRQNQLFRIKRTIKNFKNIIIYAEHIAIADLSNNFIADTNIVGKTRLEALQQILDKTLEKHRFIASGDIGGKQDILRIVRYSPLKAIIGTEDNTIINRYGGEIEFDNFNIKALNQRGQDNGVLISYGKNITGIEESLDDVELITSIIPEGQNGLLLPEYRIDSPLINKYEKVFFKKIDIPVGIVEKNGDNVGVTKEEALQKMRDIVTQMYNKEHVDLINVNYRVNFISLSKTEEYKNYAILESVFIGDTVTIKHKKLNLDLKARVFKTTYNILRDRLEEIELGFSKQTLSNIIKDTVKQIQFTKEKIEMEVSNLDKSMSSKLEITESHIRTEVNNVNSSLNSKIEQTAGSIRTEVNDQFQQTNSKIEQTANAITLTVNGINNLNSKIEQQADKINLVVDAGGNVNSAAIALAIKNNSSAISMLADTINLIPNNGVINFSNGTSIDTRDFNGQNRNNFIRLRADSYHYVCINASDGTISLYFPDGSGGSKAYWQFTKTGLYKDGKSVL